MAAAPQLARPRRAASRHDPDWEPPIPGTAPGPAAPGTNTWRWPSASSSASTTSSTSALRLHPPGAPAKGPRSASASPIPVKVTYTDWGDPQAPDRRLLRRRRQHRDALQLPRGDLESHFHVVCMDWVGRGRSGWMADQRDYSLSTYAEQLHQLIAHLGGGPVACWGPRSAAAPRSSSPPPPGARRSPDPERHRPVHPEGAAQAPLRRRSRATTSSATLGPAAQDRRLAEERRPRQRRHPLQRDFPPDQVVRRGRRPRLSPRRAGAPGLPRRRAGKPRPMAPVGSACTARCC